MRSQSTHQKRAAPVLLWTTRHRIKRHCTTQRARAHTSAARVPAPACQAMPRPRAPRDLDSLNGSTSPTAPGANGRLYSALRAGIESVQVPAGSVGSVGSAYGGGALGAAGSSARGASAVQAGAAVAKAGAVGGGDGAADVGAMAGSEGSEGSEGVGDAALPLAVDEGDVPGSTDATDVLQSAGPLRVRALGPWRALAHHHVPQCHAARLYSRAPVPCSTRTGCTPACGARHAASCCPCPSAPGPSAQRVWH